MEFLDKAGIEDGSVDLIISNCVINLSPDKKRVLKEAFRALPEPVCMRAIAACQKADNSRRSNGGLHTCRLPRTIARKHGRCSKTAHSPSERCTSPE